MNTEGTKRCSRCERTLPLDEFYVLRVRGRERLAAACKNCEKARRAIYARQRYWAEPDYRADAWERSKRHRERMRERAE